MKKLSALFLIFLSFLFLPLPAAQAEEKENRKIKIGLAEQPGLYETDENGIHSGYLYEYLKELSQFTDWDYEIYTAPGSEDESIIEMMEMLKTGEIDVMAPFLYDDQLTQDYDYAGKSLGKVYTVLQALDSSAFMNDSKINKTMKIAALTSSEIRKKELYQYCKINMITPEIIDCETENEQIQAVYDGKADALLNVSANPITGMKTIASFAERPYYFIITKGKTDIVQDINDAIAVVEQSNPDLKDNLFKKYFEETGTNYTLTKKELDFIKNGEVIHVGLRLNRPPFEYKDEKTGEIKGIDIDILKYISEQTGLRFEFTEVSSEEEMQNLIKNKELDIVTNAVYNTDKSFMQNIITTMPYLTTQYIMVMNKDINEDSMEGKRLAMPEASPYSGMTIGNIVKYPDFEACINAVSRGEADYTYGNGYTVQYYINRPEYSSLKMVAQTYEPFKECFGLVKPIDNVLLSIINKTIQNIPIDNIQPIIFQNITNKQETTLFTYIKNNPLQMTVFIIIVTCAIIAILAWSLRTRTKINKKLSVELKKHFQVYELTSEYFFEYDFSDSKLYLSIPDNNKLTENDREKYKSGVNEISEEKGKEFINLIKTFSDGTYDREVSAFDEKKHWLRITIKKGYSDNGTPEYIMGKFMLIDAEKQEKEKLIRKAQRDSLTGIFNAEACKKLITKELLVSAENNCGALLVLDIDKFKNINDTYGHPSGDTVLIDMARLLSSTFKEEIVGRLGGDEFSVYISSVRSCKDLERKCTELSDSVRKSLFDGDKKITLSIGAVFSYKGQKYEELYKKADKALYKAKENGRNRYEIVI